jgi:ribosomal protein S19E (S16A)
MALKAMGQATVKDVTAATGAIVSPILRQLESEGLVARDIDEGKGQEVWIVTVRGAHALDG